MRFLIIAYDFPPIPSPQSLRWAYLANELAEAGHEVHILAPDVEGYGAGGLPSPHATIHLHRVWPGPVAAFRAWRIRHRRSAANESSPAMGVPSATQAPSPALNWKGRLRHRLGSCLHTGPRLASVAQRLGLALSAGDSLMLLPQRIAELWLYPDIRAEWLPWARRKMLRLLMQVCPDLVITSHEPANSLPLGLLARAKGYRWVADLGDPVLSIYTPDRWRRRARALERAVCTQADLITVTATQAMDTLVRRHFVPPEKFLLVRQGYGVPAAADSGKGIVFDPSKIELFYSGSFYSFRRPDEVIAAVLEAKDVRLSVASINPPEDLVKAAQARPDAIRLLGFVPHNAVIEAQRQCDLLLNLANGDPVQVPGKLFEYLGAGRPILHIGGGGEDESSRIVADTGSGWSLRNAREDILGFLVSYDKKVGDELMAEKNKRQLGAYSWKSAASRLVDHLQLIIGDTSRNNNPSGTLMEQENDK